MCVTAQFLMALGWGDLYPLFKKEKDGDFEDLSPKSSNGADEDLAPESSKEGLRT